MGVYPGWAEALTNHGCWEREAYGGRRSRHFGSGMDDRRVQRPVHFDVLREDLSSHLSPRAPTGVNIVSV